MEQRRALGIENYVERAYLAIEKDKAAAKEDENK
ncbi:hypothetical protein SLEP1_g39964 [Rubroshorea leprosula]|uniref:Uncharacterized protein n=1 Tax=Rubroshorea leprosula TaxID=152421 RepID=A0AAV5L1Y6_9ROSI|nr:hypothetical protein SLEP1_g39964 [Rubroshorea leprosula]